MTSKIIKKSKKVGRKIKTGFKKKATERVPGGLGRKFKGKSLISILAGGIVRLAGAPAAAALAVMRPKPVGAGSDKVPKKRKK
jgi:hypothetical protein